MAERPEFPQKRSPFGPVMPEAIKAGAICIDCHKGIAHHLPREPEDSDATEKK